MTTSPFLSPSELSELLRVSLKWTYQQLNKGLIPGAFKLAGIWMVDKEILLTGLKAKASKPQPKPLTAQKKSRHDL